MPKQIINAEKTSLKKFEAVLIADIAERDSAKNPDDLLLESLRELAKDNPEIKIKKNNKEVLSGLKVPDFGDGEIKTKPFREFMRQLTVGKRKVSKKQPVAAEVEVLARHGSMCGYSSDVLSTFMGLFPSGKIYEKFEIKKEGIEEQNVQPIFEKTITIDYDQDQQRITHHIEYKSQKFSVLSRNINEVTCDTESIATLKLDIQIDGNEIKVASYQIEVDLDAKLNYKSETKTLSTKEVFDLNEEAFVLPVQQLFQEKMTIRFVNKVNQYGKYYPEVKNIENIIVRAGSNLLEQENVENKSLLPLFQLARKLTEMLDGMQKHHQFKQLNDAQVKQFIEKYRDQVNQSAPENCKQELVGELNNFEQKELMVNKILRGLPECVRYLPIARMATVKALNDDSCFDKQLENDSAITGEFSSEQLVSFFVAYKRMCAPDKKDSDDEKIKTVTEYLYNILAKNKHMGLIIQTLNNFHLDLYSPAATLEELAPLWEKHLALVERQDITPADKEVIKILECCIAVFEKENKNAEVLRKAEDAVIATNREVEKYKSDLAAVIKSKVKSSQPAFYTTNYSSVRLLKDASVANLSQGKDDSAKPVTSEVQNAAIKYNLANQLTILSHAECGLVEKAKHLEQAFTEYQSKISKIKIDSVDKSFIAKMQSVFRKGLHKIKTLFWNEAVKKEPEFIVKGNRYAIFAKTQNENRSKVTDTKGSINSGDPMSRSNSFNSSAGA